MPEESEPAGMPGRWRWLGEVAVIALIYFGLARVGQVLAIPPGNVTPVWPASGFALAAILLRGYGVWPGIWLGNFLGNTWAFFDAESLASIVRTLSVGTAIGIGDVLQVVVAAWIIRRACGDASPCRTTDGVCALLLSTVVSCLIGASIGVGSLCAGGIVDWSHFPITWLTWYLGDGIGVILIAPPLLELAGVLARPARLSRSQWLETVAMLVVAAALSLWVFEGWWLGLETEKPFVYLLIPVVLWSAVRTPPLAGVGAVLVIALVATCATTLGHGPFERETLNESLMLLQLFLGVMMTTELVMSASRTQHAEADALAERYAAELSSSNDQLRREVADRTAVENELTTIVSSAPDAILTVSDEGLILSSNLSAETIFAAEPGGLLGKRLSDLLISASIEAPRQVSEPSTSGLRQTFGGGEFAPSVSRTTLARRIDGALFPADYTMARAVKGDFTVVLVRDITERTELESSVLRAGEEEKERIARDLHDGLGSLLGGIDCLAKSLELQLDAERHGASDKVKEIGTAIKDSIRMTRRLSHGLYAVGGDPGALQEALRDFATATDAGSDVSCRFECPEAVEIHDRVFANHLFRIAQEAVTNSIRHSGTGSIRIRLECRGDRVVLSIRDRGRGISEETEQGIDQERDRGLGLRTMAYRANAVHGELTVRGLRKGGTLVRCEAPLPG